VLPESLIDRRFAAIRPRSEIRFFVRSSIRFSRCSPYLFYQVGSLFQNFQASASARSGN